MGNVEVDYNELFGVKDDAGAEGTGGTAEPDQAGDPEDNAAQDGGEPAGQELGAGGKGAGGTTQPGQTATGGQGLPDITGHQGTRGPARERDDAAFMESVIRGLGITDPYSGKPITTKEEYEAYRERIYRDRRDFIKEKTGMTDQEMDDFIHSLPEVRRAAEESARAKELMESERQRQLTERVNTEIRKIAAMDPSVKSIADLTTGDNYPQMLELVRRGYELSDAWKLANFDKLQGAAQAASRQAAINSGAGRAGFQPTKQTGQGEDTVPVPSDVLEMYREINPGATDAEIRAEYNKYLKGRKAK